MTMESRFPHDNIDPLDVQNPVKRATQRFRTNLAAGLLLDWLLSDIETKQPDYFTDLEIRLETGFDYARAWREEGTFDGEVPIHTADFNDVDFWIELEDLGILHGQLFPHGSHNAPAFADGRALVVLILHSALETLFGDLNLRRAKRESIVDAVARYIGAPVSDPLYNDLVELRETRNVVAHNGGAVDHRYLRQIPHSPLNLGEKRVVTAKDLGRFASAVRRAGDALIGVAQ
jgi:hypothetical protein